jgi:amino acid adenylation domain-containing protein
METRGLGGLIPVLLAFGHDKIAYHISKAGPMDQHSQSQTQNSQPLPTGLELEQCEIEGSIASRFEKVVRYYPERLAVKSSRYAWSYAMLNDQANRLAQTILAARGEKPEPVAVLCEHEAPLIAGMLGVVKTSKFFSVLDASLPTNKLAAIIENLQPGLIVSDGANLSLAQELVQHDCQVLAIQAQRENSLAANPALQIYGAMPYGIFYTSGSSGQPKGVERSHQLELSQVKSHVTSYRIRPTDRFSLLTSPAFLSSMIDIFRALLTGAALCLYDVKKLGIALMAEWIRQERISFLHPPPTLFRHFIGSLSPQDHFSTVRLISLAGEPVYRRDIEQARPHFGPESIFIHGYASSEAGLIARLIIHPDTQLSSPVLPVGYPTEDNEIWVLDEVGERLGTGEVGEIAIRSPVIATGYWRQAGQNQGNFLKDPQDKREPIYLSGDLGRLRPDGMLELLGRKDSMVKMRGSRVELAMIEATLLELDMFTEVVVIPQPDPAGEKKLVAYLVAGSQPAPAVNIIRSLVYQKLPDYMIPSAFVFLETIPLTPTGKPDWQALPLPDQSRPMLDQPYTPARNVLEATLAAIWEQVLGMEPIGIFDNFLDLGGNSLLAMRIIARLQEVLRIETPLRKLFDLPTVAELAAFISEAQQEQGTDAELEKLLQEVGKLSEQEVEEKLAENQRQKGFRQER